MESKSLISIEKPTYFDYEVTDSGFLYMSNKLVSIIIPVYKFNEFVIESLLSIKSQTYIYFEVLVVAEFDIEILQKNSNFINDERFIFIQGFNKGLGAALNLGIANSKGIYLARMDADDISLPERISLQVNFIKKYNLDICGTAIKAIGAKSRKYFFPSNSVKTEFYAIFGSPLAHPTVLGKSSIFKQFKYDESLTACEDYELWTRMITSGIKIGSLNKILLYYRLHSSQAHQTSKSQQENEIIIVRNYIDNLGSKYEKVKNLISGQNYFRNKVIDDKIVISVLNEILLSMRLNDCVDKSLNRLLTLIIIKCKIESLYPFYFYLKICFNGYAKYNLFVSIYLLIPKKFIKLIKKIKI
jgi:glycosyltransferase involved in cell wall biosynthesis